MLLISPFLYWLPMADHNKIFWRAVIVRCGNESCPLWTSLCSKVLMGGGGVVTGMDDLTSYPVSLTFFFFSLFLNSFQPIL